MEAACIRYTNIPHTSRLFTDFQYHFDRVSKYYAYSPHQPESYLKAAGAVQYPMQQRRQLVDALRPRNQGNPLLEELARPNTYAIVTGQQVGLFSGPAYTIYKALTAICLARELKSRGIDTVPIFWLATEDHDFAEINHTFAFDAGHHPLEFSVHTNGNGQRPVGSIHVSDAPVEMLRQAVSEWPFGDVVTGLVEAAYSNGATFGSGFQALLSSIIGADKLLFIDPLDAGVRRLAAPLLRQALELAPALSQKLLQRNQDLEASGYHTQVHFEPHTSLVFLLEGERRVSLKRQADGDYVSKDRTFSTADLAARAEHLSPNALLRPVVQDYLLPTLAYVGGPAELAYMAQSSVVYDELLGRMPIMVARTGFTLLDARASKLMRRYKLAVPDFFQGAEAVREAVAHQLAPADLIAEFQRTREQTASRLEALKQRVLTFDPTLGAALEKSRAKMLYQLTKMEQKTSREALRRNKRVAEETRYMSDLIFPEKHLQERYYSILPFLAKHGLELIQTLADNVHLECPDHKVLVV